MRERSGATSAISRTRKLQVKPCNHVAPFFGSTSASPYSFCCCFVISSMRRADALEESTSLSSIARTIIHINRTWVVPRALFASSFFHLAFCCIVKPPEKEEKDGEQKKKAKRKLTEPIVAQKLALLAVSRLERCSSRSCFVKQ